MKRYVLEGEWSGYKSSQRRVVHREVVSKPVDLSCIRYSDGTTVEISVREAKPRERITPILAYRSLIRDAMRLNKSYVSVDELRKPTPATSEGE